MTSDKASVADTLVALVQDAPGGEYNASQLCIELYSKHPGAKAVVQKYQGFRSFVENPELKGRLRFVADAVWLVRGCADVERMACNHGAHVRACTCAAGKR